ncbi:MAG: site-specific integrase [Anaerolinea sp.]|nr:site-specific integrase [Anaerolinea sp.]
MTPKSAFPDLPPIPTRVETRDGQQVETRLPVWQLRTYAHTGTLVTLNWPMLEEIAAGGIPVFSPRAVHLMKLYLVHRLQTKSPATTLKDIQRLRTFGRWLATEGIAHHPSQHGDSFEWDQFDEQLGQAYAHWCSTSTANADSLFANVRVLYQWGVTRKFPGFKWPVLKALKTIKIPPHAKGHHVRFRHVTYGPYSPDELYLIRQALDQEQGQSLDRAIIMLHLELGANPSAYCRLLNQDLKRIETSGGLWYQLDVPRVKKQRGRQERKRRRISPRLGNLLSSLQQGGPESRLLHWLSPDHPTDSIRWSMGRWAEETQLISPRTGALLSVRPRRFRYTYATRIADAGASKYHLAELLDHTDLQSIDVYVETSPAIIDQAAKATDQALTPIIHRFLGKIVDTVGVDETSPAIIPAAAPHIGLPVLNTGGLGICGRNVRADGLCQMFPPLSCYVCPSFAAWRDGPHAEILQSIEQFMELNQELTDRRIWQQLDEVRQAIQEVAQQCQTLEVVG